MKNVVLNKIELQNFMGIESGVLDFAETDTLLCAKSGCGKTSFKNAYLWVLGEKVDGYIPMVKKAGALTKEVLMDREIKVTLTFAVDGVNYVLTRIGKHEITSDRVTFEKKYKGTSANTFILNELSYNANQIQEEITNIFGCNKQLISLFLDITLFNKQFEKDNLTTVKSRRNILLSPLKSKVEEEEQRLLTKPEYSYIKEMLETYTLDQISDILRQTGLKINADMRKNVNIYQENSTQLTKFADIDFDGIKAQITALNDEKKVYESKVNNYNTASIKQDFEFKINCKKSEIMKCNNAYEESIKELQKNKLELNDKLSKITLKGKSLSLNINSIENDNKNLDSLINSNKNQIEDLNSNIEKLQKSVELLKANTKFEVTDTCPCCGQDLPQDKIDSAINELKKKNDEAIAKQEEYIAKFTETVNKLSSTTKDLEDKLIKNKESIYELQQEKSELLTNYSTIKAQIDNFKLPENAEVKTLEEELDKIKADYNWTLDNIKASLSQFTDRLEEIDKEVASLEKEYEKKTIVAFLNQANADIKKRNVELDDQDAINKQRIKLLKEYNKERLNTLGKVVSDCFDKSIEFNLFDYKPNAKDEFNQFAESCEVVYNGVVYSNLSTGEKNQADILVQIGLQKMYNVSLPLWIDDYELNQRELPITTQQKIIIRNNTDTFNGGNRIVRIGGNNE